MTEENVETSELLEGESPEAETKGCPCNVCASVDDFVRQNPWPTILSAFFLGVGIGALCCQRELLNCAQECAEDLGKKVRFW